MTAKGLLVNEVFGPTVQGEGVSLGRQATFLRLAICNLKCVWCDTKYTWDWDNYDYKTEVHEMTVDEVVTKIGELGETGLLVISGGEPLLQAIKLTPVVTEFVSRGWRVEVETAGTVLPESIEDKAEPSVWKEVFFTVSPKLAHSGNSVGDRRRPEVLATLADFYESVFKFVVQQPSDLNEVYDLTKMFGLDNSRVYIMPEGTDAETLDIRMHDIVDAVIENGWNITTRLHTQIWGSKRGV